MMIHWEFQSIMKISSREDLKKKNYQKIKTHSARFSRMSLIKQIIQLQKWLSKKKSKKRWIQSRRKTTLLSSLNEVEKYRQLGWTLLRSNTLM